MADNQSLSKLKENPIGWSAWRRQRSLVDLSGADLAAADLREADLRGTNFSGANLERTILRGTDLRSVDLRNANLRSADLTGADLRGANCSGADATAAEFCKAEIGRATFVGAKLTGANLTKGILIETDLSGATLAGVNFSEAALVGANLRSANLVRVNLYRANVGGSALKGADLTDANLLEANFQGVDFTNAILQRTNFGNTILADATGLETCTHKGPSYLDVSTLVRSGNLPITFLRGCGLPDQLIDYLPSLLNNAIQFYSCFISYSAKDQDFADRLHADLQNRGVRCWFAPHKVQGGKKLYEQIDEAIRLYDRLLLILSEASMNSEWVKTEITKARQRELRERRRMLFPVRLIAFEALQEWESFDADTGKDLAREIREYFIPDFSTWKSHDSYRKALERLLADLHEKRGRA